MLGLLLVSLICLVALVKFLIVVIQHANKRRQLAHFPQKPSYFLMGSFFEYAKMPIKVHFIKTCSKAADEFVKNGKIFMTWFTVVPVFTLFNRDHVRTILSRNEADYLNKSELLYSAIDDILPNSLLTINGNNWRIRRKILSQPFHNTNMDNFKKVMNEKSKIMIDHLRKNPCNDLVKEMKKLVIMVFCKLLFEYDVDDDVDEAVELGTEKGNSDILNVLMRKTFSIFLVSKSLHCLTGLYDEEQQIWKGLRKFKNKILDAKSESLKESLKQDHSKDLEGNRSNNLSLIGILFKNLKGTSTEKTACFDGFTIQEICSQIDTFIITGMDTLSVGLAFMIYHMAKYPEYQEQIYDEIVQVIGSDPNAELSVEEVKKLIFLENFIKESMRIQPIVPIVGRKVGCDVRLDERYTIPAGSDVLIYLAKLQLDPDYWSEPHRFQPERFFQADQSANQYANIPFSGGVRNCVVKQTSLKIMAHLACDIVRNYRVEFAPSTPREFNESNISFEIINKPTDPLELKFVPRST